MHLGLIGLGTMGANLARNAARNSATVAVYNRTTEKTDAFMNAHASEGDFVACKTIPELIAALPAPRSIVLMVNAGTPVDAVIKELLPHLEADDVLIDAGNSHFTDTERRIAELKPKGVHLLGMGVSGGEEGALKGPSMMPGGSRTAFDRLESLLRKMAAKDGSSGKCVSFIGSGGSGHFVKMIHNGIEYGDMQLIAETYHLMKSVMKLGNVEIAETFADWNKSRELKSFLIEITSVIFRKKDDMNSSDLIDAIKDEAKQKGTGKWTTQSALDLGIAVPTMTAAVDARLMSALKPLRVEAEQMVGALDLKQPKLALSALKNALFLSKICSYAQGFALIAEASRIHDWKIDLAETCRIWKGGCIIRSALLKTFEEAFRTQPDLKNLLLSPIVKELFKARHTKWRKVVAAAALSGIPIPAMSASLAYFDSLRTARLPQNLTQAQRDFFGAHTFERLDRQGVFHADWN
ncbi:NADP-dependent phosphogluconate dehydrogenase [Candidatus Peribacteria bacterium]|nr:NADP-dependent phosphogluconate dehydrogenase [Candidatus Peribacteria bacterium]